MHKIIQRQGYIIAGVYVGYCTTCVRPEEKQGNQLTKVLYMNQRLSHNHMIILLMFENHTERNPSGRKQES